MSKTFFCHHCMQHHEMKHLAVKRDKVSYCTFCEDYKRDKVSKIHKANDAIVHERNEKVSKQASELRARLRDLEYEKSLISIDNEYSLESIQL